MNKTKTLLCFAKAFNTASLKGDIKGLHGRMPYELKKLVRKVKDADNYDLAAMELLDAFDLEWRE